MTGGDHGGGGEGRAHGEGEGGEGVRLVRHGETPELVEEDDEGAAEAEGEVEEELDEPP